jgi:hypothetical protein
MEPTTIFIIPYRDRVKQKKYFEKYFEERVSKQDGMNTAEYYFIHQKIIVLLIGELLKI